MTTRPKILVIDDDPASLRLLALRLGRDGYSVLCADSGPLGLRLASEHDPDAVLLELRLAGMDGHEVCRRLQDISDAAILILTGNREPDQIVRGLELGADDYLTKPFHFDVLSARLRACLRRRAATRTRSAATQSARAPWSVDPGRREVVLGNRRVRITRKELEVLQFFLEHPDQVIAADEILKELWGPEYVGDPDLVKQFVYRLRTKLEEDPAAPRYLVTVRGSGYALEVEPRAARRATVRPKPARHPQPSRNWLWLPLTLLLFLASVSVAQASSEALPGDWAYPVKLGLEQIQVVLEADEAMDFQLYMAFSADRLHEIESLIQGRQRGDLLEAAGSYHASIEKASDILAGMASTRPDRAGELAAQYEASLVAFHQQLGSWLQAAPVKTGPAIAYAMLATEIGLAQAGELQSPSVAGETDRDASEDPVAEMATATGGLPSPEPIDPASPTPLASERAGEPAPTSEPTVTAGTQVAEPTDTPTPPGTPRDR